MYTPPKKPINTDLPCATNSTGTSASNPAPIYQPGAKAPVAPVPTTAAPAPVIPPAPYNPTLYNPAPTVASLTSQLSDATLTISKASQALGFTGPARDFLAFAQSLAVELKTLRAKK